ncbi:MAG: uroporphyrinogen-III synthase [Novosphingobium sp.]|nr:uroporphyrinogen-III synthase [Novosphingobium sp.]
MKPIIIIRPQPGCVASVTEARAMGLDAYGFPLLEVRPLPWETPDPDAVDALLLGSANAIRHGGGALASLAGKPAYAVGEKTADAARTAGFDVIATGQGGIQELLGQIQPGHTRLLRPAGQQRVEIAAPKGITVDERTVYVSEGLEMPDELAAMLTAPVVVALHSGEAARHFASCCKTRGIDRSTIALAAISKRAADMAGDGWAALKEANRPDDGGLLALAKQMCEEPGNNKAETPGSMQDQTTIQTMPPLQGSRRRGRGQLLVALLAFVLGAAAVGWLGWNGYLDPILPDRTEAQPAPEPETEEEKAAALAAPELPPTAAEQLKAVGTVEGRLAMLEDRFSRLNLQADAASGNAARAEGLLIAFATRRMVDRGEPLRYLSDQLRLRFTNAQPRAVETIVDFSEKPVTIDELTARLDALGPQLTQSSDEESLWTKTTRELGSMFVLRRESSKVMAPEARIERAKVMLTARRIPEAIEQVALLPGAEVADKWIIDARRFSETQSALDLIETAAMLEPSKLKDSDGKQIDQPSPIAAPVKAEELQKKN